MFFSILLKRIFFLQWRLKNNDHQIYHDKVICKSKRGFISLVMLLQSKSRQLMLLNHRCLTKLMWLREVLYEVHKFYLQSWEIWKDGLLVYNLQDWNNLWEIKIFFLICVNYKLLFLSIFYITATICEILKRSKKDMDYQKPSSVNNTEKIFKPITTKFLTHWALLWSKFHQQKS